MTNPKLKVNHNAIRQLLRSPEVHADLVRRARRVAAAAGPGNEVRSEIGPNRARAAVVTATFDAMNDEAVDRSLTRAIDAAR